MIYLPRTNEPGCSAGFVHGLSHRRRSRHRPQPAAGRGGGLLPDRQARIMAASVDGPVDPREQLSLCAGLGGAEAVSCIRGTKVRNLLTAPPEDLVALVRQCDGFP